MSSASIAAAAVTAQAAQTQASLATIIVKQQHQAEAAVLNIIQAASENLEAITSTPPPGLGANIDISV